MAPGTRIDCADSYAVFADGKLVIGNKHFVRITDLSEGFPRTVSMIFHDKEMADPAKRNADCSFIGLSRPGKSHTEWTLNQVFAERKKADLFDGERLIVTIRYSDSWSRGEYTRSLIIYPGQPFHAIQCTVKAPRDPQVYWNYRELRNSGNAGRNDPGNLESRLDSLKLADGIKPVSSVEFFGRSDYTNIPVKTLDIPESGACRGNLLYFQNAQGAGFCWLQEAPPSEERRDLEPYDFIFRDGEAASCCWGISPAEFQRNTEYRSNRTAVLFYDTEVERFSCVKNYISVRYPIQQDKIISLVNPWGCGHFTEYISPDFLVEDIKAAKECGADGYQIDDSWQQGGGLADFIDGRHTGLSFWKISESRMNGTFAPQIEAAKETGIKLALWLVPSFHIELEDWNEFADMVLRFYRDYGFRFFKLDGQIIRTRRAEENMERMLYKIRMESNGECYCNLDTTNGQRSGFLLFQEYGNVFLENRYLWHTACCYRPEQTLHSLWTLSRYIRPERLQIEIPAPDDLVPDTYKGMALPTDYPFDYWAAISLFACPLLWTAPSKLKDSTKKVYRHFMELHRSIREKLFGGNIYPVGEEPSGKSFCGFYADGGYLLIFREKDCSRDSALLTGVYPECRYSRPVLMEGLGEAAVCKDGFRVTLPNAAGYALFRLD